MTLAQKPIPAPILGKLIPPDRARVYFEGCAQLPFDAQSATFNIRNAWWLAEASFLAYQTPGETLNASALGAAGYQLEFISTASTQAAIIRGTVEIIVAFRGTRFEGFG